MNKLRATAATGAEQRLVAIPRRLPAEGGERPAAARRFSGLGAPESGAENYSDERLREAQEINSSLSCLNECLRARLRGDKHVPYRRAKITLLLRDALEVDGAMSTAFVACVAPSPATATESKRTLEPPPRRWKRRSSRGNGSSSRDRGVVLEEAGGA